MKKLIIIAASLIFIGCDNKITMQEVEKARLDAEMDKKELTNRLRLKFDSEYNHMEFCNKYGALYYVNDSTYGYVISAPVLDKDSKVIPCVRTE